MALQNDNSCCHGAGLIIVCCTTMKILLILRSQKVPVPGRWAAPGGNVKVGEDELDAALRRARDVLGSLPEDLSIEEEPSRWHTPSICFATYLGTTSGRDWEPVLNWEADDWGWFDLRRLPKPIIAGTVSAIEDFFAIES